MSIIFGYVFLVWKLQWQNHESPPKSYPFYKPCEKVVNNQIGLFERDSTINSVQNHIF